MSRSLQSGCVQLLYNYPFLAFNYLFFSFNYLFLAYVVKM